LRQASDLALARPGSGPGSPQTGNGERVGDRLPREAGHLLFEMISIFFSIRER
jgi:hypothetical protein